MDRLKIQKLRASTLLEVIIAMVIIMVVFVLAIGIYTHVTRFSPSAKSQQARLLAENILLKSIEEQDWEDGQLKRDSLILEKTVVPYEEDPDLLLIQVAAIEQGQVLTTIRKIVKRNKDER